MAVLLVACTPQPSVPPPHGVGEANETVCTVQQKAAQACTLEYAPVCGWNDPAKIQCFKYPCAQTYGNQCQACAAENVLSWTPGECPK